MDRDDIKGLVLVGLIIIAGIGAIIHGFTWLFSVTYAGQEYEVTVTVQAVEKSTRFWTHTNVWVQVYGDQDITYMLQGYHDLEVGKTYHIRFRNKLVWHWLAGFNILGKVESIKEAGA